MFDLFFSPKEIKNLKRMSKRQLLLQFVNASYSVMGTYMLWKLIGLFLNNDSPIVVVLSESMEPGFKRGDILFLSPRPYDVGDMTVFQINKKEIPIVHRAIRKLGSRVLTKGDNNMRDDVPLYRPGQYMLEPSDIISCVFGSIPYFGMITIWINTFPWIKILILFCIGMTVFFTRDE